MRGYIGRIAQAALFPAARPPPARCQRRSPAPRVTHRASALSVSLPRPCRMAARRRWGQGRPLLGLCSLRCTGTDPPPSINPRSLSALCSAPLRPEEWSRPLSLGQRQRRVPRVTHKAERGKLRLVRFPDDRGCVRCGLCATQDRAVVFGWGPGWRDARVGAATAGRAGRPPPAAPQPRGAPPAHPHPYPPTYPSTHSPTYPHPCPHPYPHPRTLYPRRAVSTSGQSSSTPSPSSSALSPAPSPATRAPAAAVAAAAL